MKLPSLPNLKMGGCFIVFEFENIFAMDIHLMEIALTLIKNK